jgi:ribosomal protein S18 acetylase RimI-like enzyme
VTVVIRPAGPDDHEAAIAVWQASDEARRGGPYPAEVPDQLRQRFARDDIWVLVADDDGTTVGVTQGAPAREDDGAGPPIAGRCHLSLVCVSPRRWGEGIGGRLVDAALDHARSLGYDWVQLFTHEGNARAQRLYAGRGFRRDGVVRDDAWGESIGRWSRAL